MFGAHGFDCRDGGGTYAGHCRGMVPTPWGDYVVGQENWVRTHDNPPTAGYLAIIPNGGPKEYLGLNQAKKERCEWRH